MAEPTAQERFSPGYRAYVLGILLVAYILNFIDRSIFGVLLPQIKAELALHDWQLGVLGGMAFALFYATVGLPIARWADRGHRVNIITLAIIVWSAMTALCGAAASFVQLFLFRAGVGVGEAGATPPSHSIIGDIYPPERRASAMGIYAIGVFAGGALGLFIGGWLAQLYGWRVAFLAVGLPGVLVALLVKLTVREPPRGLSEGRVADAGAHATVWETMRLVWSRPTFRNIAFGKGLISIIIYSNQIWVPSFLSRSHGLELSQIGTALGAVTLAAGMAGVVIGGFLSDWLGKRDPRWWMWLTAVANMLTLPFAIAAYLVSDLWLALACLFVPTVTIGFNTAPGFSITQRLVGLRMRAMVSAILLFIISLIGSGIGPFLVGLASDALTHTYGVESLRYALVAAQGFVVWSCWHYYLAGRTVAADLARAPP
ncbi:MAG: spinster family MFS transporter [Gammaproteobacteria bacterium]